MKSIKKNLLANAMATAIVLSGSLTGLAQNAFADEATPTPAAQTAPAAPAVSDPSGAQKTPSLASIAKKNKIELYAHKLAYATYLVSDVSLQDINDMLNSGKSLLQIGRDNGNFESDDAFIQKLSDLAYQNVDAAVRASTIAPEVGDQLKAYAASEIAKEVRDSSYRDKQKSNIHFKELLPLPAGLKAGQVAKDLGMKKEELAQALQNGQSLADIAAAKGITSDQLLSKLKDDMSASLQTLIAQKKAVPAPDASGTSSSN